MSNPTRPVWMLPATGAALATTASLIGGINVDDPNVVPSVKAKKLLRTLVLGAAAGLGAEAMLRGGGIAYRGLMSKSSSAEQIKRFRNKTLYSLIKQGEEGDPIVPSVAPVPADPIENESQLTSPAAPTTPTTPTQPPAENNPLAPPATNPLPDPTKEAPTKEPWHRQSPLGIPNGYIGYGLGTLAGAGLLYHFLTEKKKRKPSGYLNSMGAGLLAGLLGYGLYDFSQGGSSKEKEEPEQRYKLPEEVSSLPNTGVLSDYEIETDENGLPKYDNNGNPIPVKARSSEERRAIEIRNQELANDRETQRFNNNSLKPLNFAWYTSNNDAVNTKVNQSINWELNNNSQFSKMMTSFVMGASLNEAYYDKQTAPEFQRNIQEYDQVMCQNAQKQITQNIQDILIREGIPEEQAPAQAAEVFNSIYNFYKSDPRAIPYKATTLAEDISTYAFNSNLAQFRPNDARLPGYTTELGGNSEATKYALGNTFPHIEWRMGRKMSDQEKRTLLDLANNLRLQLHNMDEAAKRGDYTVPGGQDYFGKGSYQPWWYEWYAKAFGIRRQQAMDRAQNWANDRAKVLEAKNDIKDFFVGVLAKPVNTAPTVAPTTTTTEVPVLNNTSPISQNPAAVAPTTTGQPATPTTPVVPAVGSEPSATNGGVVPPNTVAPAQPNVQKVFDPTVPLAQQLHPKAVDHLVSHHWYDPNSITTAKPDLNQSNDLWTVYNIRFKNGEPATLKIDNRTGAILGTPPSSEYYLGESQKAVDQAINAEEEDRDNTIVPGIGPDGGNKPSLGLSPEARDVFRLLGLGQAVGGAGAAAGLGGYKLYQHYNTPPVTIEDIVANNPISKTQLARIRNGRIPTQQEAADVVNLMSGRTSVDEFFYPGITENADSYIPRIINNTQSMLQTESPESINYVLDYNKVQGVAQEEIAAITDKQTALSNQYQTATPQEKPNIKRQWEILDRKKAKWQNISRYGKPSSLEGGGIIETSVDNLMNEIKDIYKSGALSPSMNTVYSNYTERLSQLDDLYNAGKISDTELSLLKQDATFDMMAKATGNDIYTYWRDETQRALDLHNTNQEYRISPAEERDLAQRKNIRFNNNVNQAMNELGVQEDVEKAVEINKLKNELRVARRDGNLGRVKEINNLLKNKYGIAHADFLDNELNDIAEFNVNQELENVQRKRFNSLSKRYRKLSRSGDADGAAKLRSAIIKEFGIEPELPIEQRIGQRIQNTVDSINSKLPKDKINTFRKFEQIPFRKFEQIESPSFSFDKWLSESFAPITENTGLSEDFANIPEQRLSPRAQQRYDFRKSMESYADELEEAELKRQADALRAKLKNDFEDVIHPNPGSRIPKAAPATKSEENLLGNLLKEEPVITPSGSPEPVVRPATSTVGSPLASDSAGALAGQQQKAVDNFRPLPTASEMNSLNELIAQKDADIQKALNKTDFGADTNEANVLSQERDALVKRRTSVQQARIRNAKVENNARGIPTTEPTPTPAPIENKPVSTPTKGLTIEKLDNIAEQANIAANGSRGPKAAKQAVKNVITDALRGRSADDAATIINHLAKKGVLPPDFVAPVAVKPIMIEGAAEVAPKIPGVKPVSVSTPILFGADLLARGINDSVEDAKAYGRQVYEYRTSMGDSYEQASRISQEAYWDRLQDLALERGLDQTLPTLVDWTLGLPQHLRNGYEWLWSLTGETPNYWTPTDTSKINFSSLANSNNKFDDILGTATHSIVDSTEALADVVYTASTKPTKKLIETGKSLSELDHYRRTHNPDGSLKNPRFKSPRTENERATAIPVEGNITPEILNTAVNLAKMDPVSRRVNMKLLPEDTQAIIYDILKNMPINGQLLPL